MLDYPRKTFKFDIYLPMYKAVKALPFGNKLGIVSLTTTALLGRMSTVDSATGTIHIEGTEAVELPDYVFDVDVKSRMYEGFPPDTDEVISYNLYLPWEADLWYVNQGKLNLSIAMYKNLYNLYYPEPQKGKYISNWFSNFKDMSVPIRTSDGTEYFTVENYYQAMKTKDLDVRKDVARMSASQSKQWAKELKNNFKQREDWQDINQTVMYKALQHKYSKCPEHRDLLFQSSRPIVEFNNWNDKFWGVSVFDFQGENRLGKMLMHIRYALDDVIPF